VSSLMDTWLLLSNVANNGERTRTLQVLKSRGMNHSNQVREFVFSDRGLNLVDVHMSGERVLTGAARVVNLKRGSPAIPRGPAGGDQSLAGQIAALIVAHAEASGLDVGATDGASSSGRPAGNRVPPHRGARRAPGANGRARRVG